MVLVPNDLKDILKHMVYHVYIMYINLLMHGCSMIPLAPRSSRS